MTVTGLTDVNEIEEELSVFLKNSDVLTTTVRGVTTTNATGTWTGATSHIINASNVRNIRSITVGGTPIAFGTDYLVDYFYDNAGTRVCKITLNAAQTGNYNISYDYGSTDKIYTDWPQETINISSYPRIIAEVLNTPRKDGSIDGLQKEVTIQASVTVMAADKEDLNNYIKTITQKILEAQLLFYYTPYMTIMALGPLLPQPGRGDKIFSRTLELQGRYKIETIS